ncbi:MAG: hypothetical protein AB7F19_01240 [Candidatus Babeliales bacterium]
MYLKLDKISEDAESVSYRIESTIYEETPTKIIKTVVKALCIFDKKLETITFDNEKTDAYYFNCQWEPIYILHHLKKLNRIGEPFPDMYDIVTGG